ncbi:MAG: ribbon-helix-helix domain-containing protein [Rhodoferax sp.]
MSTVTMQISLTDDIKVFAGNRIQTGNCPSSSDYVGDLVQREKDRFRALIQEGFACGPGRPWAEHKSGVLARIEVANGRRIARWHEARRCIASRRSRRPSGRFLPLIFLDFYLVF